MHAIANYLHTPPPARRRAATTRMAPAGVAILLTFYVVKQTKGWKGFFLHAKRIIFGHSRFLSQQLVINLPGSLAQVAGRCRLLIFPTWFYLVVKLRSCFL